MATYEVPVTFLVTVEADSSDSAFAMVAEMPHRDIQESDEIPYIGEPQPLEDDNLA